jgi:hypothetical protein
MSDVYQSEINPDDEPGERLQEALRGIDQNDHDADGKIARAGIDAARTAPGSETGAIAQADNKQ